MNKPSTKTRERAAVGTGSVCVGEIMPLAELHRRFGLSYKATKLMERKGLRMVEMGRCKYVLGADVVRFFEQLAAEQNPATAKEEKTD